MHLFYQISWPWSNHDNATSSKIKQATVLRRWKKHHSISLNLLDTNIKKDWWHHASPAYNPIQRRFWQTSDHQHTQTHQCILYKQKPSQVKILQKQQQNRICNLELTILLHEKLDYEPWKRAWSDIPLATLVSTVTCPREHHLAR
jgi:hypothetical protein